MKKLMAGVPPSILPPFRMPGASPLLTPKRGDRENEERESFNVGSPAERWRGVVNEHKLQVHTLLTERGLCRAYAVAGA